MMWLVSKGGGGSGTAEVSIDRKLGENIYFLHVKVILSVLSYPDISVVSVDIYWSLG